jgi:hypothetical protein
MTVIRDRQTSNESEKGAERCVEQDMRRQKCLPRIERRKKEVAKNRRWDIGEEN